MEEGQNGIWKNNQADDSEQVRLLFYDGVRLAADVFLARDGVLVHSASYVPAGAQRSMVLQLPFFRQASFCKGSLSPKESIGLSYGMNRTA